MAESEDRIHQGEQATFKDSDQADNGVLDRQVIDKGNAFLVRIGEITPIPDLRFSGSPSVFVFVPMLSEYENAQRVYESWRGQQIPPGVRAEVIFLVNNTQCAPDEIKEDNRRTYEFLQGVIGNDERHPGIGFHVVDKFSEENALPDGARIADVRNIAVSPIIKHAVDTERNSVVLSTDADCFPSPNVVESLHSVFKQRKSLYGVVERELEYPPSISDDEKKQIERLFYIGDTEGVLLEYLTYGDWSRVVTTAGSSTFYSIDNFLNVDGYTSAPRVPEDSTLGDKLSQIDHDGFVALEDCKITNLQRYSDRVLGDGAFLQTALERGNKTPLHAEKTIAHARLRKWLISNLAIESTSARGIEMRADSYIQLAQMLQEVGAEKIHEAFDVSGDTLEEISERVYEKAINKIYNKLYGIEEALKSFGELVEQILGDDEQFRELAEKLRRKGMSEEEIPHVALQLFLLQQSDSEL